MAKAILGTGKSFQQVRENKTVLRRAYEMHFRRGLPWTAVEQELGLKNAGGMTAWNCAERYIDVTDDDRVRAEGNAWRAKRKAAVARKRQSRPSDEPSSPPVPSIRTPSAATRQIDARIDQRLREFATNLAQAIKMAAG